MQLSGESSSSNQLRGIYGNHGEHNDKVMYRKVDSTASIYFDGQWKIGLHGALHGKASQELLLMLLALCDTHLRKPLPNPPERGLPC